jgi:hypothetical protein
MAHHAPHLPSCANCSYDFTAAPGPADFCPRCGQQNHALDLSLGHVLEELLEGIFHFDGKVFRTARLLLLRPGQLTRQFLLGHRVPYVPPVRLYIFLSFVCFFLLSLQAGHERKKVLRSAVTQLQAPALVSPTDSQRLQQLGVPAADLDSLRSTQGRSGLNIPISRRTVLTFQDVGSLPEEASAAQIDSVIRSKGEQPGTLNRLAVKRLLRWRDATGEDISHQLLRALSLILFVLMPLAALLLKLVYLRRNRPYLSHLIFTVHMQCFLFLLVSVYVVLTMLHAPDWLTDYLPLLAAVYFVLSLRTVYQQSWARTLAKSVALGLAYSVAFLLTMSLVTAAGIAFF